MHQEALMKYDPATGEEKPYPSDAQQWREYHGKAAWLINPWTGERRLAHDVGSDPFGNLVSAAVSAAAPLLAAEKSGDGFPKIGSGLSDVCKSEGFYSTKRLGKRLLASLDDHQGIEREDGKMYLKFDEVAFEQRAGEALVSFYFSGEETYGISVPRSEPGDIVRVHGISGRMEFWFQKG